jgi:hypothetical protein
VAEQAVMDWLPAIEPTGEIHEEDAALAEWLSQQPQVAGEEEFEFPQTDQWLEKALEEDLTGQLLAAESSEEPKPAWLVDFEESEETVARITRVDGRHSSTCGRGCPGCCRWRRKIR